MPLSMRNNEFNGFDELIIVDMTRFKFKQTQLPIIYKEEALIPNPKNTRVFEGFFVYCDSVLTPFLKSSIFLTISN